MPRLQQLATVFLAALLVAPLAAHADEPAASGAGFAMPLFNGKDLSGWQVTDCEAVVEDGLLILKNGDGFVRTDHRYGDFVLDLDWRSRKKDKWDSGVYFRAE